ncbi:hypothetical protein LXM50_02230 [Microbacterium sp. Au-Mic1]|uniref:hypothetical protein n=1 Tax=Microbacterium sp. Au-Mic1 TaxID=2906457 RepID=UPI001E5FEDF1|nr:hypothetical protein [Microbacterium sp. Au-Mic1]MCE4024785.1 hypothetical protein [Microbacterium sp. Au-Mic1]
MHRSRTTRIIGALMVGACAALISGCAAWSPQADAERSARQGLAAMVEKSQDQIWQFRALLSRDPESALPDIDGLVDLRLHSAEGSWLLTDLRRDDSGTAMTLTTSAGGESGGGLFYAQVSLRTCWTLIVAPDGTRIDTEAADCDEGAAAGRAPEPLREATIVPLTDLEVRSHVDETDYPALPCQCSSGEVCDCPGG